MRRVENPPNPYLSEHHEWLGPAPPARLEVFEDASRGILSENDSPDIPFRWSVNPYRGCQHACSYCYARATHEYLGLGAGTDFDTKILVKPEAARLLAKALARPSWRRERIAFSGVTDCYQPLEAAWKLTQSCLQVCCDFANPVTIVTKSFLVVRDADLLVRLHKLARASVFLSIPFADDRVARKVETGAPPPSSRFQAMRRLREAGVPVGIMLAPVIPGLNDRDIPTLLARAADAGATAAGMMPLRLPRGVREVFLTRLRRELPDRAARVEARIRAMRGGDWNDARFGHRMHAEGAYWRSVRQLFDKSVRRFGLSHETRENDAPKPNRPEQMRLFD